MTQEDAKNAHARQGTQWNEMFDGPCVIAKTEALAVHLQFNVFQPEILDYPPLMNNEIIHPVGQLKSGKTPGTDMIQHELIKSNLKWQAQC